jgi:hypothetical protein
MRPVRSLAALALAALSLLIGAATADAAYYVNKPVAEHYLRNLLHSWDMTNTAVYCRPKRGKNESVMSSDGVRLWHKWSCGFVAGEPGYSCKGVVSIYGSDHGAGYYYFRHSTRGEAC